MTASDLPDDLARLEAALAARARPAPSAALRERVLASARRERARSARRMGPWEFAAAVAAVVLVCLNLSMAAVRALPRFAPASPAPEATAALARLAPHLGEREARRQALLLAAAGRTALLPDVRVSPASLSHRDMPCP